MNDKAFDRPVLVRNGHFMIEEISCLEDAFEFLHKWPQERRGPIFETAVRACQRAYDGDAPVPLARDAFAGFARSAKILEDVSASMPWMAGTKVGQGGVVA
ncbi:DUF982 domain-containing protein [Mesorhizobium sp. ES1-4]|uniref:DUF982 domain-containing protein n=1 Tax=Mesorhizobium sp. ES1-4 TaxID=2876627 RepID=UPI001CCE1C6B|nr:DUF982 domain-containing protein [Mesorhizobium sp. ES1-4]MBZ9799009.1 DUF982 domain-containing protein [Mesorhizobium sp. ES1-4]